MYPVNTCNLLPLAAPSSAAAVCRSGCRERGRDSVQNLIMSNSIPDDFQKIHRTNPLQTIITPYRRCKKCALWRHTQCRHTRIMGVCNLSAELTFNPYMPRFFPSLSRLYCAGLQPIIQQMRTTGGGGGMATQLYPVVWCPRPTPAPQQSPWVRDL